MAEVNSQSDRLTVFEETGTGVASVYPLRFELGYVKREEIYVYQGAHGDYNNQLPYTWIDNDNIEVNVPLGEKFWVRRIVNRADLNYYFKTASLHPATIDKVHLQLLMLSQELMDGFGDRDGLGNIKNILDMRDFRIENLGAGRAGSNDAVNMTQFEAVSLQLDRIDAAVAATEQNAIEATLQADRAEIEADRAQDAAAAVQITPMDALVWLDAGDPVESDLAVSIEKQPEAPQAVANDYVLVSINGELKKVQVKNLMPTGSAYDIRGVVDLVDASNAGTVTDQVDNDTQYFISTNNYPSPNAAIGHAFTVMTAVKNSITGELRDWDIGDILLWTNSGWVALDVAVTSWQGKIGDVTVELGDISSNVVHEGTNSGKSLTTSLAETVKLSNGTTGGISVPRWANDAARPDTSGYTKSVLGYNILREIYEAWNPETGRWGAVGGGGLTEPTTPALNEYPFVAETGFNIHVDLSDDVSKVVTVPAGWDVGHGLTVHTVNWTGNPGVNAFVDVSAGYQLDLPDNYGVKTILKVGGGETAVLQVNVDGKMTLQGSQPNMRAVKKGKTVLYEGITIGSNSDIPLSDNINNYDDIQIYAKFVYSGALRVSSMTVSPDTLITDNNVGDYLQVTNFTNSTSQYYTGGIFTHNTLSSATSLRVSATGLGGYTGGINKVVGIKY